MVCIHSSKAEDVENQFNEKIDSVPEADIDTRDSLEAQKRDVLS